MLFRPVTPTPEMLSVQNRIVMAANKYADGTIIIGVRHMDTIMHGTIRLMPHLVNVGSIQGFIDRNWQFCTREEAWTIAEAAGQIIRPDGGAPGRLYSEHLY